MIRAKQTEGNRVHIFCPGCRLPHGIVIGKWTWNQNLESPTFRPSLMIQRRMGNYLPIDHPDFKYRDEVCHSFVTEGKIQFLTDSTHELSGQTVELPEWPYSEEEYA